MKTYFLICSLLLAGYSVKTQVLTKSSPEAQGMSSERLERITTMLEEEISLNHIPGAVAMVCRNGHIVYHKAFGQSKESGQPLDVDDIFRIASQTKAITSTAVMILWEQAFFRLDDPISKYIPEFSDPQVMTSFRYEDTTFTSEPANREITIRDLLTHQSGIGYGVIDGDERMKLLYHKHGITDLYTTKPITIEDNIKRLAKLPLHHHPGEKYTYSEGLDVLGYFIEIVSGMPFDQFLRTHLFDPLGMNDTWFYLPEDKGQRLVAVQHQVDDEWQNFPVTFYDPDYPRKGSMTFFSGGAGLSSTAKDYAAFLQMYVNDGMYNNKRILSRTTIETMMQNQIGDLWNGRAEYGLAFGIVNESGVAQGGRGSIGTFDWGGYFNTQYFADPNEDIIGILFKQTQGNSGDQSGWKFRQLVFQAVDD